MQHQPRLLAVAGVAMLVLAVLTLSLFAVQPPPAFAGVWTELLCNAAGTPAQIGGMTPGAAPGTLATNDCNLATGGGLISAATTTAAAGAAATWTYTAPGDSTITGGSMNVQLYAPGGGEAYISTPGPGLDATDLIAGCATATSQCGAGATTQTLAIPDRGGTHLYSSALCPSSCTAGAAGGLFASVNLFSLAIQLTSNAVPAATAFTGALTGTAPVSGVVPLGLSATDPGGPGVLSVTVLLDSTVAYAATPDSNGGACASAGAGGSNSYEFLSPQPCSAGPLAVSIPVDTTKVPDGSHDLKVYVEDAAQNVSLVLNKPITTTNAPASPTPTPAPAPVHPCTLNPQRKPTISFEAHALAHRKLEFTGSLHDPFHCGFGAAATRPVILIEDKNGTHWQDVVTARVSPRASFKATYLSGKGSIGGAFTFRAVLAQTATFKRAVSADRRVRVHK
jgi:hypothetical protein